MINYILQNVLELRGFILINVAAILLLTVAALVMLGRKRRGLRSFGVPEALLMSCSQWDLCFLALGGLELGFVFSLVLFPQPLGQEQVVLLAALCLLRGALGWKSGAVPAELLYGVMAAAALTAGGLLHDFMSETGFDWYIMVIRILLSGFIIQYSLYHFIKSVERMLRRNEKTR